MQKLASDIEGCFFLKPRNLTDNRGSFVKTFSKSVYEKLNISFLSEEEYYSVSAKNVFRGFHFQTPPHDHDKIIYCAKGHILDIIIDLRKQSPSFGKHITIELRADDPLIVFLPKGCAHGFYTFKDDSIVVYKVTTEYAPENDKGILWNSVNIAWPCAVEDLIVSDRDRTFPSFQDFNSPF